MGGGVGEQGRTGGIWESQRTSQPPGATRKDHTPPTAGPLTHVLDADGPKGGRAPSLSAWLTDQWKSERHSLLV